MDEQGGTGRRGMPGHRPVMEGWVELVVSSGACLTSLRVRKSEDTEWSLARTGTHMSRCHLGAVRQYSTQQVFRRNRCIGN